MQLEHGICCGGCGGRRCWYSTASACVFITGGLQNLRIYFSHGLSHRRPEGEKEEEEEEEEEVSLTAYNK